MTRYVIDEDRGLLPAYWSTGHGDVARNVADLPPSIDRETALDLAGELTGLSEVLWRCYTHPASAAPTLEPNTTGWRRQHNRDAFGKVLPALTKPNVPQHGTIRISYTPVEESAHRVGRTLHALGDAG